MTPGRTAADDAAPNRNLLRDAPAKNCWPIIAANNAGALLPETGESPNLALQCHQGTNRANQTRDGRK